MHILRPMTRGTLKQALISEPLAQRIGGNIRRERERADLTQAVLADRAGINQSTLSRIEKGTYQGLDLEHIVKLTLALGCQLEDTLFALDMAMAVVHERRRVAA